MKKTNENKTYLVRYGLGTGGEGEGREDFDWGLIEAKNTAEAEELALRKHCPEAFETHYGRRPDELGEWTEWGGHRAFQFNEDHSEVDMNTSYWIEAVLEVPDADAFILRKYLLYPEYQSR